MPTLKAAIESGKNFKLPEATEWLTVNADDKIVNARTGALVTIKASDMIRTDWDTKAYPNLRVLTPARRDALLNMAFQMGTAGVMKFKQMLAALDNKDWQRAKAMALDSAWATQTPQRAHRVAQQLMTGEYYKV